MADRQPDRREMGFYYSLAQVGLEMVVPVVLGIFVDVYCRTMPWAIVIGAVAGFGLGMYHLITLVNQHDRENSQPSNKEQESK